jgi:hypothetical protein
MSKPHKVEIAQTCSRRLSKERSDTMREVRRIAQSLKRSQKTSKVRSSNGIGGNNCADVFTSLDGLFKASHHPLNGELFREGIFVPSFHVTIGF